MNALIVAFFVSAGSPSAPMPDPVAREFDGGARPVAAVVDAEESSKPDEMIRPAIRVIEDNRILFDPDRPSPIA